MDARHEVGHDRWKTMPSRNPRLFTIPASVPFLPALIDALLAGRLVDGFPGSRDPMELAQATLYLPTRRACRRSSTTTMR